MINKYSVLRDPHHNKRFAFTEERDAHVLPNDDWFVDIAQEKINKISGKARMGNGERDLNSPTASISTMSMSSVRSHGSS
ncbi:hypothetical protein IEQ34_022911 [Dendrobium chrysotoxum]|uniref:Uncharacterized protein n=1 Tax=Dendrobium chrysotoxum TaxID=161865 RepID=A0AAV7FYT2_DENCH|nr:hypothetical protein IEQ34_022911 [Dendrobium chrysotoxum]